MSLKDRLQQDMQAALKAGDKARLSVVRMALAGVKQREVDTRRPLDDTGVTTVIERMIKQAHDSVDQYGAGGRGDLVAKEMAEIAILETYLPRQLNDEETDAHVSEAIDAAGATGPKDIGKVMAEAKARATGRVDMSEVSARVRAALAKE
jgi:uncharacterized protein YqeY